MQIHFRHRNLWGELQEREMEIIYQSDTMMITRYTIDSAPEPLMVNSEPVLEDGYTAVSFIEYGKWYIIDKIFNLQGAPTGFLTKLVTPVEENLTALTTMDLFVKIWITLQNDYQIFNTKMFKKVAADGLLSETVEKKSLETMDYLISVVKERKFPPDMVKDFRIPERAHE